MRKLDWGNSAFQSTGIIPDSGDELTYLWGVKIVKNLMNGYGIIGTVRLSSMDTLFINFGLTRIYQFPPTVFCLYTIDGGTSLSSNDTLVPFKSVSHFVERRVQTAIKGDFLGLRANLNFNSTGNRVTLYDVYFRIHGV